MLITLPDTPKGNITPEFCDGRQIRLLFGLSRTHAYALAKEGLIRSISLRKPGAIRGRRLFDCASIRAFLNKHAAAGLAHENGD